MALTPVDVQQKTFSSSVLKGYDVDEVDDYLDEVVLTLSDYERRLQEAEDRSRRLEHEIQNRDESENAISRALVAAQRSADAIVSEARARADEIVADAESRASVVEAQRARLSEDTVGELERVRSTLGELRAALHDRVASIEGELGGLLSLVESALDGRRVDDSARHEQEVADEFASGFLEEILGSESEEPAVTVPEPEPEPEPEVSEPEVEIAEPAAQDHGWSDRITAFRFGGDDRTDEGERVQRPWER